MLLRPKLFLLILFGLLSLIGILTIFYSQSLSFFNLLDITALIYVWVPIFVFSAITFFIDSVRKTKLRRYAFTAFVSLTVAYLVFPSTKKWIIKNTENRGDALFLAIKDYKKKFSYYPKHLDDPFFTSFYKTALINRPFYYETYKSKNDSSFKIFCYSFDGLILIRYSSSDEWHYSD